MMLLGASYRAMTQSLMQVADEVCHGRLALSHEGGYSASYVPYCGLAVMEALSGVDTGVGDPFADHYEGRPGQALLPHQAAAVEAAVGLLDRI